MWARIRHLPRSMPTDTSRLSAELLELIAAHVPSAVDLLALLSALPTELLTPPLQSLRELATHVEPASLWPTLALPHDVRPHVATLIESSLRVLPAVAVAAPSPSILSLSLPPSTGVQLLALPSPAAYSVAMTQWRDHITSLTIRFENDNEPMRWTGDAVQAWCTQLTTLPRVTSLRLHWALDATDEVSEAPAALLKAIAASSLTDVSLTFETWFTWDMSMSKVFAAWLDAASVSRIALTGLFLPQQSPEARLLCDSMLLAPSLQSIALRGGNVTASFLQSRHRLGHHVSALALDGCTHELLPHLAATIGDSQLSDLALGFRRPCAASVGLPRVLSTMLDAVLRTVFWRSQQKCALETVLSETIARLPHLQRLCVKGLATASMPLPAL
ncbi:hypothetical protein SPRG_10150 [Saprolegnia parasitica CBS 223.65]|uniref:F-box domain-containing protein n=1 Tax=Saprolegnia parasitica (strain CBS 223.65) TaxID=695850 RepID=A0A067C265_SAPPC|nr:hypothetical protein SPRG_10150 [Saprolegnia parasitica CBS 223.65]KDO24618.1 hypothetical protein SPRG_10150 [Saprolegnia parasitica CBS 223.65]|eukprot:XP_012204686.1 hypothetical protein SPRG_10150 [Saprolegnia parasitica CBS 223.65]